MYKRWNVPNTEPWGTSLIVLDHSEYDSFITTLWIYSFLAQLTAAGWPHRKNEYLKCSAWQRANCLITFDSALNIWAHRCSPYSRTMGYWYRHEVVTTYPCACRFWDRAKIQLWSQMQGLFFFLEKTRHFSVHWWLVRIGYFLWILRECFFLITN